MCLHSLPFHKYIQKQTPFHLNHHPSNNISLMSTIYPYPKSTYHHHYYALKSLLTFCCVGLVLFHYCVYHDLRVTFQGGLENEYCPFTREKCQPGP